MKEVESHTPLLLNARRRAARLLQDLLQQELGPDQPVAGHQARRHTVDAARRLVHTIDRILTRPNP